MGSIRLQKQEGVAQGSWTKMEAHLQCRHMLEVVCVPALDRPVLAGREEEVRLRNKLGEEEEEEQKREQQ